MGCIAKVKQMHKRKDGLVSLFVEGLYRGEMVALVEDGSFLSATVNKLASIDDFDRDEEREAYSEYIKDLFKKYASYYPKVGNGLIAHINSIKKVGSLADQVVAGLPINFEKKQEILEILSDSERVEAVAIILSNRSCFIHLSFKIGVIFPFKLSLIYPAIILPFKTIKLTVFSRSSLKL